MRLMSCYHRFLIGLLTSLLATSTYGTTKLVKIRLNVDFELGATTHQSTTFEEFIQQIYLPEIQKRFPDYDPQSGLKGMINKRVAIPTTWTVQDVAKRRRIILKENDHNEVRMIKEGEKVGLEEVSVDHETEPTFKVTVASIYKLEVDDSISFDDFNEKVIATIKERFPGWECSAGTEHYHYLQGKKYRTLKNSNLSNVITSNKIVKVSFGGDENPTITLDKTVVRIEGRKIEQGARIWIGLFVVFCIFRAIISSKKTSKETKDVKIRWVRKKKKRKKRW